MYAVTNFILTVFGEGLGDGVYESKDSVTVSGVFDELEDGFIVVGYISFDCEEEVRAGRVELCNLEGNCLR
jgi:hypothetical protein